MSTLFSYDGLHWISHRLRVLKGIGFALLLGVLPGGMLQGAPLPEANDFQKVPIVTGLANAVDFEFSPDGRIFILNRYGGVSVYKPDTQTTVSAAQLAVYIGIESGLIGIALDPDFESNQYIYLFYSPVTRSVNRLSRFHVSGDTVDLGSEVVMLEVRVDRLGGHHDSGNLEFDQFSNLYIGTGDDTLHGPYAALNETSAVRSAEKSSANTMDLRGKILRIHPEPDGTYSIPPGNLFGLPVQGLPEIYVMGARNPYKFFIDPVTNWLFWGDVGPDGNVDNELGSSGKDEINRTEVAGNYGWPHFMGPNVPYLNTYLGYYFNPALPTNDSRWNTGPRELPPAQPAWISQPRAAFMAGPVYHFDSSASNPAMLPASFDGHFFYWDFNTSNVWYVGFDASGAIIRHEPWDAVSQLGLGYIDFELGPDHQLYVLEYGTGCCEFDVGNGVLSRLDYVGTTSNLTPIAQISAEPRFGSVPLTVDFSSAGTQDPDGDPIFLSWDFETDGVVDASAPTATHTYTQAGTYNAQLKVEDAQGAFSVANITIHAGNNIANVDFAWPPQGGMFEWREFIDASVSVSDVEDGSIQTGEIACSTVNIIPALGHLEHTHDAPSFNNCEATIQLFTDHKPNGEDDLFYQLQASYLDNDGLESFSTVQIHPKRVPLEFNDGASAIQLVQSTDSAYAARNAVRALADLSYVMLGNRSLQGIDGVNYRVAATGGGSIELRLDAADGPLLQSVPVPATGGTDSWVNVQGAVADPGGVHDLYLVFRAVTPTATELFDVVSVEFLGPGISYRSPPVLTTLELQPTSAKLLVGDVIPFAVTGYDQYGDAFPAAVSWTASGGGAIDSGGVFTATTPGIAPFTVTAASTTDGTVIGTASVTVADRLPAPPGNLALGMLVVAPTQEAAEYVPLNAVDGDPSTRWASAAGIDPQWIYVDMGAVYTIDHVVLSWEAAYGKAYQIQVSENATTWSTVFTESNGNGGLDDIGFTPVNARYVRLLGTQRGTQWGYSLWEFEVYGVSAPPAPAVLSSISVAPATSSVILGNTQLYSATGRDQYGSLFPTAVTWQVSDGGSIDVNGVFTASVLGGPFTVTATSTADTSISGSAQVSVTDVAPVPSGNLAASRPAVSLSQEGTQYGAAKAVDSSSTSRWASAAGVDPQWLYVDLGAVYPIDRVVLNWERAYGKAYQIQVTTDAAVTPATTWSTVFTESNGNGGLDDIGFTPPVNARYVRLLGTQRGTQWGYSLWEFEVYGVSAPPAPAVLSSISVAPATSSVILGNTQLYSATGRDQYGSLFPTAVTWQVSDGGSIDVNGVFTASVLGGPFTVTATSTADTSISGSAQVSVTDVAPVPSGNLAASRPAVSLSQEGTQYGAAKAVDSSSTSRWASAAGVDPQWLYVDLGAVYPIDRVVLNWERAYGKAYQIQVTTDAAVTPATTWSTVFTESNGNGGLDDIGFTPPVNARYVRLLGTQRGTQWGYSLWEFEVYGVSAPPAPAVLSSISVAPATSSVILGNTQLYSATGRDQYGSLFPTAVTWQVSDGGSIDVNGVFTASVLGGPFTVTATSTADTSISGTAQVSVTDVAPVPSGNLAASRPAVSLSQEGTQYGAAKAVDGSSTSRWASVAGVDPQWLYVDLGAVYPIDRVVLNWERAYGKAYQIQVTTDAAVTPATTWSPVFTESNGNGGLDDIGFTPPVNARYVRLLGTQRGTQWGYSLWEFEVYGVSAPP